MSHLQIPDGLSTHAPVIMICIMFYKCLPLVKLGKPRLSSVPSLWKAEALGLMSALK